MKPNLIKIIEFRAHVGYVKRISASIVSGKRVALAKSPMSPATPLRRGHSGPSAMELIYNYSHYMYGALWVADDSVDGERGTVRCLHNTSVMHFSYTFCKVCLLDPNASILPDSIKCYD